MKEATGELSGTMITVIAIAAVAAIFTAVILPTIKSSINSRLHCAEAYDCTCSGNTCSCIYDGDNGTVNVTCKDTATANNSN